MNCQEKKKGSRNWDFKEQEHNCRIGVEGIRKIWVLHAIGYLKGQTNNKPRDK